jgi:hypothetical protein
MVYVSNLGFKVNVSVSKYLKGDALREQISPKVMVYVRKYPKGDGIREQFEL